MKRSGFFLLAAGVLVVAHAVHADDGATKAERWVETVEIGEEICNLKKEIELTPEQAGKVFQKDFPWLKADWRDQLPGKIEPAPGARPLPDEKSALNLKPKDTTQYAEVLRFSPNNVVIVVLKPEGSFLWRHDFDCLACLRAPRSAEMDALFGIKNLEKTYGAVYKGVKQGDTAESVAKALGKADAIETTQPVGYFHYYYFKDDIVVTFLDGKVQKIETGVPKSVKKGDDKQR